MGVSPAFLLKSKRSKLALMADVGGGASVTGELSANASGDVEISDYALEYETSIGKDRDLSASVHPADRCAAAVTMRMRAREHVRIAQC